MPQLHETPITLAAARRIDTPSLRGKVSAMAGLAVTERDRRGLRLEKYREMPVRGAIKDERETSERTAANERIEPPLYEDTGPKAA